MGAAEGSERCQLNHGTHPTLEENRQNDDVQWHRLTESRVDLDVIAGNLGQQDALLLHCTLPDQAFPDAKELREVLALLVAVAGLELQYGLAAVGFR